MEILMNLENLNKTHSFVQYKLISCQSIPKDENYAKYKINRLLNTVVLATLDFPLIKVLTNNVIYQL